MSDRIIDDHLRALQRVLVPIAADALLAPVIAELDVDPPSRTGVGRAVEAALDAVKEQAAFETVIDSAEPIVRRIVDWLGTDFAHVLNLLRHKQLGRRYPVEVREYDSAWPARYDQEATFLLERFGGCLVRVEHFGSTAVPGLASKPVIDVLLEITSFEAAERELRPALEAAGYAYFWRSDSQPPHMMFAKGYGPDGFLPGVQPVHLHAAPAKHPIWERLLFRDYLRIHPDAARRYEALKRQLAQHFPHDREAYTRGKADFVGELTALARGMRTF